MEYGLVLLWLVAFQALALVGTPLAAVCFPRFADRGAAFALPISLAIMTIVVYWVGRISFGTITIVGVLTLLAALSVLALRYGDGIDPSNYVEVAAVFTVAFLFLVAIRAVDPGVVPGGGEKFLDYGLLNSLVRADQLPPEDFWFAGEPVRYYFGGHLMASLLTELTGTPVNYAYNLALAGFYAMLATAVYGLAGAIAADHGASRQLAGGLGAFLVAFASNLHTPVRVVLVLLPDGLGRALAGPIGIDPATVAPGGLRMLFPDIFGVPPEQVPDGMAFSYWTASRAIPGTINEFPLFSFLNGDLHAHMMSTPFLLLVAALLYGYYRTPGTGLLRRRLLLAAVVPVGGLLALTNTWSFPAVGGLSLLALTFAPAHPLSLLPRSLADRLGVAADAREVGGSWMNREVSRIGAALGIAVGVTLLAVLSVAPFFFGTASGRPVAFLPDRSGFGGLLLVHGAFLLLVALYLLPRVRPLVRRGRADRLVVLSGLFVTVGWLENVAAVLLVGPLLLLAWLLLRDDRDVGYELVLFVAGAGLVLLVEFLYIDDHMGGKYERMNTVFKLYMQVWVLWGVSAAVALARLVGGRFPVPSFTGSDTAERALGAGLAVVLVVSLSTYGVAAVGSHLANPAQQEATLDATYYIDHETEYAKYYGFNPEEGEAINWLDENVEGQPNMLSKPGLDIYQWVNAPSSLTGIPTVAGWVHEKGYRDGELYDRRVADVRTMYTGSWEQRRALLQRYNVEYVYVGPGEREEYGTDEVDFSQYPGISVAFENERVTIYRVDRSSL